MTSVVEICNLALGNIRAGSINSLDEASVQAQNCKLRYELLRDQLLRETTWQFARKIEPLALVTDEIFTYAYTYRYPSDCLKIERLIGLYEQNIAGGSFALSRFVDSQLMNVKQREIPYAIFSTGTAKLIGTNDPDLRIDYTAKVSDPNLFSTNFIMALGHLLASEIAIPIVGVDVGRRLRSDSIQLYKEYLASAIAADANEKHYETPESEFVTIRR